MQRIKITITAEIEYAPNPEYYTSGTTVESMLECDLANARHDPFMAMDGDNTKWTFTGEVIDAPASAISKALGDANHDSARLDYLTEEQVDTIYFDDGRILDVGGSNRPHDIRAAIDAMKKVPPQR